MFKVDSAKPWLARLFPYCVFFLASSFSLYEYLMRVMPSAMAHPLMHSFHLQAQGLGILASLFYYGYAPMQIPAGLLFDRFGPRKLLALSTLLCAISGLIFGHADSVVVAGIGRFLTGFTASFAFIGALLVAARWFHPSRFAMFSGLVQMLGCLGAILGEAPISALVSTIGWRSTAQILAMIGIGTSAAIWLVIRDHPKARQKTKRDMVSPKPIQRTSTWTGIKRISRNPQTWWIALYGFCCWAPMCIFATLWGPSFLSTLYHMPMLSATAMTSTIWVAIGLGSPFVGWWTNHIGQRRLPLALCSAIGLIASSIFLYGGQLPHIEMLILLFAFGLSASAQVVTFGLVLDNNHDHVMGTAMGFNNMAIIGSGIILQPLVGIILGHLFNKNPFYINHLPFYSLHDYHLALITIPICFIVGLFVSLLFIKETHCKRNLQPDYQPKLHNLGQQSAQV